MASYPRIRQCEATGAEQSSSPSVSRDNISDPLPFTLAPQPSQGTEQIEARSVYVVQEQHHHHVPTAGPPGTMIQTARMPLQSAMPTASAMMQRPHYAPSYSGYEPFTTADQVVYPPAMAMQVSRPQQPSAHPSAMPRTPAQAHKLSAPPWSNQLQEHSPQDILPSPTNLKPATVHAPCTIASPVSSGESAAAAGVTYSVCGDGHIWLQPDELTNMLL